MSGSYRDDRSLKHEAFLGIQNKRGHEVEASEDVHVRQKRLWILHLVSVEIQGFQGGF